MTELWKRVFIFVGSTVLLTTYIAREIVRESVKDDKDRLTAAAERGWRLSDEQVGASEELLNTEEDLVAQGKIGADSLAQRLSSMPFRRRMLASTLPLLDAYVQLADALRDGKDEAREIRRLRIRVPEIQRMGERVFIDVDGDVSKIPEGLEKQNILNEELDRYVTAVSTFNFDLKDVFPRLQDKEVIDMEYADKRLKFWNYVCFGLFSFGWLLSLIGSFYGVKGEIAE